MTQIPTPFLFYSSPLEQSKTHLKRLMAFPIDNAMELPTSGMWPPTYSNTFLPEELEEDDD